MNIEALLKSKSSYAHSIFGGCFIAAGIIATNPAVQQWITAVFQGHPLAASGIILLSLTVAGYTPSHSSAGTLVVARDIKAAPDAPTAKQVDAADSDIPKIQ